MSSLPLASSREVGSAESFYRRLLELYPADFREQYREEMAQVFSETWSRLQNEGAYRRLRYGAHMLRDWVGSMAEEWWVASRWEAKLGCVGLFACLVIDIIGGAYYPVICWALGCSFFLLVSFVFLGSASNRSSLAIQALALGAIGLCFPALLSPLHHLSRSNKDYMDTAQMVSCLVGAVLMGAYFFRSPLIPPDYARADAKYSRVCTIKKADHYRSSLWIACLLTPVAWTWYLLGYSAIRDGSQWLILTNALYVCLARTYYIRTEAAAKL